MNFLTAPVLYGLAGLALAGWSVAGIKSLQLAAERAETAEVRAELAEQRQAWADAKAAQEAAAREQERAEALRMAELTAAYEREMQEAADAYQSTIDGLRDGSIRLRQHWTACVADGVPGTADSAAGADETARLRDESAGRIVRLADDCDARIRGLQGVIEGGR